MNRFYSNLSILFLAIGTALSQSSPVPLINQPLQPTSVAPGSATFSLTVNGAGFVGSSVVNWNGVARPTTFVSKSQLSATIYAADVATASTGTVTVTSPAPGGGKSNAVYLPIRVSSTSVSLNASTLSIGGYPGLVTVADINNDGHPDLVTALYITGNPSPDNVSVELGNGDGTFQAPIVTPVSNFVSGIAIADFNGDGKPDLAVAIQNSGSGDADIFLGNGDGTFQAPIVFPSPSQAYAIVVGDFNQDGNADFGLKTSGEVYVYLGNGNGTFQSAIIYYPTISILGNLLSADFNGDGKPDLVFASFYYADVEVALGNGDGTFQPLVSYPAGVTTVVVAAADFNGDGKLDLAALDSTSALGILLGNGDGSFQPPVTYATAGYPSGISFADMNGDGKLDLVVSASQFDATSLSILLGNGDGTFQAHRDYPALAGSSVATLDLNNDGKMDAVMASNNVLSLLTQDSGTVVVLNPTSLTFRTQLVGTVSEAKNVQIKNNSKRVLTITSIAATSNFSQTNSCGSSLAAGQRCTVSVFFTPAQQGNLIGYLTVADNGGGSPQTVSLSGTATMVTLSPSSINFGSWPVGTKSAPQKVLVTNHGDSHLSITSISIGGSNGTDFSQVNACGAGLNPLSSCTVDVWFTPGAKGARMGTLSVYDNGGGSPQQVSLTGTGQ